MVKRIFIVILMTLLIIIINSNFIAISNGAGKVSTGDYSEVSQTTRGK